MIKLVFFSDYPNANNAIQTADFYVVKKKSLFFQTESSDKWIPTLMA